MSAEEIEGRRKFIGVIGLKFTVPCPLSCMIDRVFGIYNRGIGVLTSSLSHARRSPVFRPEGPVG